jgi:hypothetical protein
MGWFSKDPVDASKGEVDPGNGKTFYLRDDGSNVVENTRVKLSSEEKAEARSRGEVEVRRDNRTITLSSDGNDITPEVVYYD